MKRNESHIAIKPDKGCDYAKSCLHCHLPLCLKEEYTPKQRHLFDVVRSHLALPDQVYFVNRVYNLTQP